MTKEHRPQVLNVSGDRLESLDELAPLIHLRHLMANDNYLESSNEVADVLSGFNALEKAELLGNPCVTKARYGLGRERGGKRERERKREREKGE